MLIRSPSSSPGWSKNRTRKPRARSAAYRSRAGGMPGPVAANTKFACGRRHRETEPGERRRESRARRADAVAVGPHVRRVGDGRGRGLLRGPVEVVAVLHLRHLGGHRGVRERQADAQAGEGVGLGEGPHDHEARVLRQQRQARLVGELRVGFVGHHDPGERGEQPLDPRRREADPVRRVRRREEEHGGLDPGHRQVPRVARQGHLDDPRRGRGREHGVQGVRGPEARHGAALVDERAHDDGEQLVGPVARHHLLRLDAVHPRRALAQRPAGGVGVEPEARPGRGAQGLDGPGRRRVGVLVGVQLDDALPGARLQARNVGGHRPDGLPHEGERVVAVHGGTECSRKPGGRTRPARLP